MRCQREHLWDSERGEVLLADYRSIMDMVLGGMLSNREGSETDEEDISAGEVARQQIKRSCMQDTGLASNAP